MKSDGFFQGGAAESCATNEQNQRLAPKCGQKASIETVEEFSKVPAPASRKALIAVREGLLRRASQVTSYGAKARCWTLIRNIDGLLKHPDDNALLKQMAANTADLERHMKDDQL